MDATDSRQLTSDTLELEQSNSDSYSVASSSFPPSTRRSSITGEFVNEGIPGLSSRTSFSSIQQIQSPEQDAIAAVDFADIKLQQICIDEKDINIKRIAVRCDPFAHFHCAFGFQGELGDLSAAPDTKKDFLEAVHGEQRAIGFIQQGLTSYIVAINSGEHHTFSADFLQHQNQAYETTIKQLDAIKEHLLEVIAEVDQSDHHHDNAEIAEDLKVAFMHARPWVQRTRAILVESHVFYKINYVLGSDKKTGTVPE